MFVVFVAWASVCWFWAFMFEQDEFRPVHHSMLEYLPAEAWGVLSGLTAILIFLSNHGIVRGLTVLMAMRWAGFYWTFVGFLFWLSGASATGWRVYLLMGALSFAFVLRERRRGHA